MFLIPSRFLHFFSFFLSFCSSFSSFFPFPFPFPFPSPSPPPPCSWVTLTTSSLRRQADSFQMIPWAAHFVFPINKNDRFLTTKLSIMNNCYQFQIQCYVYAPGSTNSAGLHRRIQSQAISMMTSPPLLSSGCQYDR